VVLPRAVALLALAVLAAGCGGAQRTGAAAGGCLGPGNHWFGDALLHVPPAPARERPLVVAFHGYTQTGGTFAQYSGLPAFADRHRFAVLFPTAARNRFWSLNRRVSPDDVPRVAKLLDRVEPLACVDRARVYATGVSNGGGFTARVGCELSDRFAAVAPVAGGYSALDPCPPSHRVSMLEIHSLDDQVVPYRGRGPDHAGNVPRFVAGWARRDGCSGAPPRCPDGLAVEHIVVRGEPHSWYEHSNERVWRFFRDKRR
jgi:polyhydroxybutyrate depolymerase